MIQRLLNRLGLMRQRDVESAFLFLHDRDPKRVITDREWRNAFRLAKGINPPPPSIPEQYEQIEYELLGILRGIGDLGENASIEAKTLYGIEANAKVRVLTTQLQEIRKYLVAQGRTEDTLVTLRQLEDRIIAVKRSIYVDLMSIDPTTIP